MTLHVLILWISNQIYFYSGVTDAINFVNKLVQFLLQPNTAQDETENHHYSKY